MNLGSDMYRAQILDHYKHPRNHGELEDADFWHQDDNPLCGDEIRMDVKLDTDSEVIEKVTFSGHGCAISQAAASLLTCIVPGKTVPEVEAMDTGDMLEILGIQPNPMRIKCAVLALKVLQAAIKRHQQGLDHPDAGSA